MARASFFMAIFITILCTACSKQMSVSSQHKIADSNHIILLSSDNPKTSYYQELAQKEMLEQYGEAGKGGDIYSLTYNASNSSAQNNLLQKITDLINQDQLIHVLISLNPFPGRDELLMDVRKTLPDLLILSGGSDEDELALEAASDLIISTNVLAYHYGLTDIAKEAGANNIVYLSVGNEFQNLQGQKRLIAFKAGEQDFGLKINLEILPDAPSKMNAVEERQFQIDYLKKNLKTLLTKYSSDNKSVAFFVSETELLPTLIETLKDEPRAIFLGSPNPFPFDQFRDIFQLQFKDKEASPRTIVKNIDTQLKTNMAGRLNLWASPEPYYTSKVLLNLALHMLEENKQRVKIEDVAQAYEDVGAANAFKIIYSIDAETGIKANAHFEINADSFVIGTGRSHSSELQIDALYYQTDIKTSK